MSTEITPELLAQAAELLAKQSQDQPAQDGQPAQDAPALPLPVREAAEAKSPAPERELPDASALPASVFTTTQGDGTAIGVGFMQARGDDGKPKGKPRIGVYVVPVRDGAVTRSEKNQFGMLGAKAVRPELISTILDNEKGAREIAAFVAEHYAK